MHMVLVQTTGLLTNKLTLVPTTVISKTPKVVIFYFWGPDSAPYHVAIATGNGSYIQAPTPGQNVQTGNINYYTPSFYISMN